VHPCGELAMCVVVGRYHCASLWGVSDVHRCGDVSICIVVGSQGDAFVWVVGAVFYYDVQYNTQLHYCALLRGANEVHYLCILVERYQHALFRGASAAHSCGK
jgi:hypothetical protein